MMKNPRSLFPRRAKQVSLLLAGLTLSLAGGCVVYPAHPVVYGPPPPPPAEVVSVAPGPGYVWIRGHWVWRHGNYVWIRGHWSPRPTAGSVWIEGHTEYRGGTYVYVDGYWR
jgi:hypothetical protein